MEMKNYLPSLLEGFCTKKSVAVEWPHACRLLTEGKLREATERYRATRQWADKASMPSITPGCQLNGTGKEAADILGLTGVSMADFDKFANGEQLEEARARVNADPHTLLSYVTVSGNGLRVLFRYVSHMAENPAPASSQTAHGGGASACAWQGFTPQTKQRYEEAFLQGNCYYADLIGHPFDEKCANVNRLSALCHDPQAYFNEAAVPFVLESGEAPSLEKEAPKATETEPSAPSGSPSCSASGNPHLSHTEAGHPLRPDGGGFRPPLPPSPIEYAVEVVERRGDCYTPGNRNQYLMKCLMMMNKLGISRYEAEQWALSHDLGEGEIRSIVRSCYSHAAEHGSYRMPEHLLHCDNVTRADFPTHTRTREEQHSPLSTLNSPLSTKFSSPLPIAEVDFPQPPLLPCRNWPRFLQRIVDCGETAAQRDTMLLGALTVLGASLHRRLRFLYGNKYLYPCLQTFVVAPPASGKGALTWTRKLVEPLHEELMGQYQLAMDSYRKEKAAYDNAGKAKAELPEPQKPPLKMFLIAGNNSATGVLENLMDAAGVGLICESEADTVSAAIGTEYGHWSDTLRKAFDHDRLSYNRRTNREYREIQETFLSVLLSGTPAQVQPLIPSAENGLFSRQIFYTMPPANRWISQFGTGTSMADLNELFEMWGKEWLEELSRLTTRLSVMTFRLTDRQIACFDETFSNLFSVAGSAMRGTLKSSVARLAVNILRMMSVVAFLRSMEEPQLLLPDEEIPAENIADGTASRFTLCIADDDFESVLSLAHPLHSHAAYVLSLLPATEVAATKVSVTDLLLTMLGARFTSAEAREAGLQMGINENTIRQCLKRMVDGGTLSNPSRGVYIITRACAGNDAM